jgi:hypothetical protein
LWYKQRKKYRREIERVSGGLQDSVAALPLVCVHPRVRASFDNGLVSSGVKVGRRGLSLRLAGKCGATMLDRGGHDMGDLLTIGKEDMAQRTPVVF